MKKFDKEQQFRFEIKIDVFVKEFDYDQAMKKIIDEVNRINDGNMKIEEIKDAHGVLSL